MKSYTNIEQSKVLAKILPLESADMHYVLIDTDEDKYDAGLGKYIGILPHYPCWSLAALYALLPERTDMSKAYSDDCVTMVYWCWTVMSEDENKCDMIIETSDYDNPVDACYEMIIKLHERNLL